MAFPYETAGKFVRYALLAMVAFTGAWLWWVPIRCVMDGETFHWANSFGLAQLSGTGMRGHFPILILLSTYLIATIYQGWRAPRTPFPLMLLVWCGVQLASSIVSVRQDPEAYRFRGDTFGIDISLAVVAPTLCGIMLALALLWVFGGSWVNPPAGAPHWKRTNTWLLCLVVLILPLQFWLFREGEPHGNSDRIALLLTILQWVFLNVAFMPWGRERGLGAAASE